MLGGRNKPVSKTYNMGSKMKECNFCTFLEVDYTGMACRSVRCPQWIELSKSKEPIKEAYINKGLTLSTVVNDAFESELCVSGLDDTLYTITRENAKQAIEIMIEHFKGRRLTDDEADAIARLI